MKKKMKESKPGEIIKNETDYENYNTYYKCYNDFMDTMGEQEKKDIMPDINEIDPVYKKLTDYVIDVKGRNEESCKSIIKEMKTSETRNSTILPRDAVVSLLGTSKLQQCIDDNPCHNLSFKNIPKCTYKRSKTDSQKAQKDKDGKVIRAPIDIYVPQSSCCIRDTSTHSDIGAAETVDKDGKINKKHITRYNLSNYEQTHRKYTNYIDKKTGKCRDSLYNTSVQRYKKDDLTKLLTNKNLINKKINEKKSEIVMIEYIQNYLIYYNQKHLEKTSGKPSKDAKIFYIKKEVGNTQYLATVQAYKDLKTVPKFNPSKPTKLSNHAKLFQLHKYFNNKLDLQGLINGKILEQKDLEEILEFAEENDKNTFTFTDINRDTVYKKAESKTPYEEKKLKNNYDRCMGTIAGYLP
jgi:hypothetical protein